MPTNKHMTVSFLLMLIEKNIPLEQSYRLHTTLTYYSWSNTTILINMEIIKYFRYFQVSETNWHSATKDKQVSNSFLNILLCSHLRDLQLLLLTAGHLKQLINTHRGA